MGVWLSGCFFWMGGYVVCACVRVRVCRCMDVFVGVCGCMCVSVW